MKLLLGLLLVWPTFICLNAAADDSITQNLLFSSGGMINEDYITNKEYLNGQKDAFFEENSGETEWLVPDTLARNSFQIKKGMHLKVFKDSLPACNSNVGEIYFKRDDSTEYYGFKTDCQLLDIFQRFTVIAKSKELLKNVTKSDTLKKVTPNKISASLNNVLFTYYKGNIDELHSLLAGYIRDNSDLSDSELIELLKSSFTLENVEYTGDTANSGKHTYFLHGKETVLRWGADFLFTYSQDRGLKYIGAGEILQEIKINGVPHFVIHTGQQGTGMVSISLCRFENGDLKTIFDEGGHSD